MTRFASLARTRPSPSLLSASLLMGLMGLVGAPGCSSGPSARGVTVGAMPAGGSFHGAWLSPQYGDMHLCVSGTHVIGSYEKGDRSGEIRGQVEGNTLWFTWSEEREYVPGQPIESEGQGYFQLSIDESMGGDNVLTGEWGHGDSRTDGGAWTATKRRRAGPDSCDGSSAPPSEALSWDEEDEGGDDSAGEPDEL